MVDSSSNESSRKLSRGRFWFWGGATAVVLLLVGLLRLQVQVGNGVAQNLATKAPSPAMKSTAPDVSTKSNYQRVNEIIEENSIPNDLQRQLDRADDASIASVIDLLSHPDKKVRYRAADKLGELAANPVALQPLLKLLSDPADTVRWSVIKALEKQGAGSLQAIEALGKLLHNDEDVLAFIYAADALKSLGKTGPESARAVAQILQAAMPKIEETRLKDIVEAYTTLGDATLPAIPALTNMLGKTVANPTIVGVLAQYGQFDPLSSVISATGTMKSAEQIELALGIGRMRPLSTEGFDILGKLLKSSVPEVRVACLKALAECEPKREEAIPLLEQGQSDTDQSVRVAATEAFAGYSLSPARKIAGMLKQLVTTRYDRFGGERGKICDAIVETKEDGFREIVKLLGDSQAPPELQDMAVLMFVSIWKDSFFQEETAEDLKKILHRGDARLINRVGAAYALSKLQSDDSRVLPTLIEGVASDSLSLDIRERLVYALPHGDQAMLPVLLPIAQACETPLPESATEEQKEGRNRLYGQALFALSRLTSADPQVILPRLLFGARQDNADIKWRALEALANFGLDSPEAVEVARASLKHESDSVRQNAAIVLGQMHQVAASAIPELQSSLRDKDSSVRGKAVIALGNFGPAAERVVPDLIAMLADESLFPSGVAPTLIKIARDDPRVREALIRALERKVVAYEAASALGELGEVARDAVPVIRRLLPMAEPGYRFAFLQTLAKIGEPAKVAVPDIILLLAHPEADVRALAAKTLGQMQEYAAAAVPDLIKLLADPSEDVQNNVLMALQRFGITAKPAIPDIQKFAAATKSEELKNLAGRVLARLNADPGKTDPKLFYMLLDEETWHQESKKLAPTDANFVALSDLLAHPDKGISDRAWSVIVSLSAQPTGKTLLQNILNDKQPLPSEAASIRHRQRAIAAIMLETLPESGDPLELAKSLVPWLENDQVSWQASRLLVRLGQPAVPLIVEFLVNPKISILKRNPVIQFISTNLEFERRRFEPLLLEQMKQGDAEHRRAAALALAQFNPREGQTVPSILECLNGDDQEFKQAAVIAVAELAKAEMDIQAAVSALMKVMVQTPADPEKRSPEGPNLFYIAARALSKSGIRAEELPKLREILQAANKTSKQENADLYEMALFSRATIEVISSLGLQAADALPDIRDAIPSDVLVGDTETIQSWSRSLSKIGPPAIEMLTNLIRQADGRLKSRLLAMQILQEIGTEGESATKLWQDLLQDPEPQIKARAAIALIENDTPSENAITAIREFLKVNQPLQDGTDPRSIMIEKLRELKTRAVAVVPELLQLANQGAENPGISVQAITCLTEIAPESAEVRAAWVEGLKTLPDEVVQSLVEQTSKQFRTQSIPELIQILEKETGRARNRAVSVLGEWEEDAVAAIPALRTLAKPGTSETDRRTLIALARIDASAKDLVPLLMPLLTQDRENRYQIGQALEHLGPHAADVLPNLIEMTKDSSNSALAYRIIGSMGPAAKPALPMLLEAAVQTNPDYSAIVAIGTLGPDAAELAPELIRRVRQGSVSFVVIKSLAKMGEPARQAVEQLRQDLRDENQRLTALRALHDFGPVAAPAVPELIEYVNGTDAQIQVVAIDVLSAIGPEAKPAVEALAAVLGHSDPRVSDAAAGALRSIGTDALPVLPQIIESLPRPRLRTQLKLLELIQELGPAARDAVPVLIKLQQSTDPDVRRQVRLALQKCK